MENTIENNSDEFWYNDPKVLLKFDRFIEFFPNPNLSLAEKLNALVRLSIYICIILIVFYGNYLYIYIPIVVLAFTFLIFKNYNPEKKENLMDYKSLLNSIDNLVLKKKDCSKTTINNPFMNANLITDKRDRDPACQYYDDPEVAAKVEKNFDNNLYRDVSDLYNKRNSQRQYYTMPATTIPNEQTSFAKWLYLSPPTCKEDTIRCVPQTTQPPQAEINLESLQLQN
jgi:hypothetical protein